MVRWPRRDDIALFSQIVSAVVGLLVISTLLGNVVAGLSPDSRQSLFWVALAAVGYGASFGLYRIARWMQRRDVGTGNVDLRDLDRRIELQHVLAEMKGLASVLEGLTQGQGDDSLPALMQWIPPPRAVLSLYQTLRDSSQTTFSKVRSLTLSTDLKEWAELASGLVQLTQSYSTFLDEYQRAVRIETDDARERLHLCLSAYNHYARHLRVFLQRLEAALPGLYRAPFVMAKLRAQPQQ